MKILTTIVAATGLLALAATSALAGTEEYCDGYARREANKGSGVNAVGGALTGAVGGAILGGILGGNKGAGKGAAAGAVGGGVVGATAGWQKRYIAAYNKCIDSVVAEPVANIPPVGSPQWDDLCSQKYNSFNSNPQYPGYFLGFDGQYHLCKLP